MRGLPDLGRLFSNLALPPPLTLGDPALERTRLFEAVARLLERIAAERPLAMLIDDLHWADQASLDLLPRRYHLAIAGNICHLFDEPANRRLLSILYDALAPGGTLTIVDVLPDKDHSSRSVALYALGLHLRTGGGGLHRLEAYQEWLADTGFQPLDIHQLVDEFPLMLIIAGKASGRLSIVFAP